MQVLLLEDNPGDARLITEFLSEASRIRATVTHVTSMDAALGALDVSVFDVAVVDLALPDSNGEPTVETLTSLHPELPIVVLTGTEDDGIAARAMQSGAQDYIVKGRADPDSLGSALRYARERHTLLTRVRRESYVDALTGLYNRSGFAACATQFLRVADRSGQQAVLVFADMDYLKRINDTYGHLAGDAAIERAGAALREVFRASDVLARIGGDEFAALAIMEAGESAPAVLRRVTRRLAEINSGAAQEIPLSLSLGCAVYEPGSGEALEDIVARADREMYQQKVARKAARN